MGSRYAGQSNADQTRSRSAPVAVGPVVGSAKNSCPEISCWQGAALRLRYGCAFRCAYKVKRINSIKGKTVEQRFFAAPILLSDYFTSFGVRSAHWQVSILGFSLSWKNIKNQNLASWPKKWVRKLKYLVCRADVTNDYLKMIEKTWKTRGKNQEIM